MTQDEIIEMARPRAWHGKVEGWTFNSYEELEAFTKLVAEREREEFAVHAVDIARRAIAEEREACLKIVGDKAWHYPTPTWATAIANAIRARGQA